MEQKACPEQHPGVFVAQGTSRLSKIQEAPIQRKSSPAARGVGPGRSRGFSADHHEIFKTGVFRWFLIISSDAEIPSFLRVPVDTLRFLFDPERGVKRHQIDGDVLSIWHAQALYHIIHDPQFFPQDPPRRGFLPGIPEEKIKFEAKDGSGMSAIQPQVRCSFQFLLAFCFAFTVLLLRTSKASRTPFND